MKNVFLILFISLITITAVAQDRHLKIENPALEMGGNPLPYYIARQPVILTDNIMQYAGAIPGVITFWDYQTNGANLNNIFKRGDTIIVTYPNVDSTDALGATTRVAYYVYSDDNGATWSSPLPLSTLPARSGYPELIYFVDPGSGPNVVLVGRKYNGSNSRGGAWTDAAFGLGSFTSLNVPEPGRDYFGSLISGTTIGGAFSSPIDANTDSLFFCKYNAANNTMSGKVNLATAPDGIAGNVRYRYTSNGNNMFVMWYQNTTGAYAMRYKTSSDGGSTWSSIGALQQVNGIGHVVNGDTCSSWFGMDAVYKPGTTNWCAVWSTLFPTATGQTAGYAQGCKILFSSPGINGGNPVEVAGRINMPIISDTNLFYNRAALQVGVTPVSHPSIAWSSNGSRVVVAFSAFQPGDSADGFAFNDIWMTYSDNGGLNWATPVNLTNTHDWDELYPTLSEVGNTPTSFTVKFQATKGPGSSSFSNNAPVYRVYHVVKTFNPQSIGIKEIASETPKSFSLHQNYPNPFNPVTTIRFDISKNSRVTLKVFDITGKEVSSLLNNELISKGTKEIVFDASSLPSGAYFYTLSTDNFKETRKMLLIK